MILAGTMAVLLVACDEDGDAVQEPSPSQTVSKGGLTEYNPSSALVVVGRDGLRACIEVIAEVADEDSAAEAIASALGAAQQDARWPGSFGTPVVDKGCPLPPVALDEDLPNEGAPCLAEVSPYLVFVFVADAARLLERYPPELLEETDGVRKASEERILGSRGCLGDVSEAWYLTPDELGDNELLRRFIFGPLGIFTIADFRSD